MENAMSLAPIVLLAFNRPKHLEIMLEALKANTLAEESDLFIYIDGPRHEEDVEKVEQVRVVCENASGFKTCTITKRERNMGLANSTITAITEQIHNFGKVIMVEDDTLTSPHFLSFMNRALDFYEQDNTVFCVSGYTFPHGKITIPATYPYDTYSGYRALTWGIATWRNRWDTVAWSMDFYEEFINDKEKVALYGRSGNDAVKNLTLQYQGRIDSWSCRFGYAQFINEAYCIRPVKSLVMNTGLDGSGIHCEYDDRFEHRELDLSWQPLNFCPGTDVDPVIAQSIAHLYNNPPKQPKSPRPWYKKTYIWKKSKVIRDFFRRMRARG